MRAERPPAAGARLPRSELRRPPPRAAVLRRGGLDRGALPEHLPLARREPQLHADRAAARAAAARASCCRWSARRSSATPPTRPSPAGRLRTCSAFMELEIPDDLRDGFGYPADHAARPREHPRPDLRPADGHRRRGEERRSWRRRDRCSARAARGAAAALWRPTPAGVELVEVARRGRPRPLHRHVHGLPAAPGDDGRRRCGRRCSTSTGSTRSRSRDRASRLRPRRDSPPRSETTSATAVSRRARAVWRRARVSRRRRLRQR